MENWKFPIFACAQAHSIAEPLYDLWNLEVESKLKMQAISTGGLNLSFVIVCLDTWLQSFKGANEMNK